MGERRGGGIGIIGGDSNGVVGEEDREEERELEGEIEEKGIVAVIGVELFRPPFSKGIESVP